MSKVFFQNILDFINHKDSPVLSFTFKCSKKFFLFFQTHQLAPPAAALQFIQSLDSALYKVFLRKPNSVDMPAQYLGNLCWRQALLYA